MAEPSQSMKEYQISVNGNRFSISSIYGESHVRKVEHFLGQQIEMIHQQSETYNQTHLALLVALNLADRLLRQQQSPFSEQTEQKLQNLCQALDSAL